MIRRHTTKLNCKIVESDDRSMKKTNDRWMMQTNLHVEQAIDNDHDDEHEEEHDDDVWRYSLRPNLSLFNISLASNDCPLADNEQVDLTTNAATFDYLNDIFHSTKIEDD